jgi:hypothetical protein
LSQLDEFECMKFFNTYEELNEHSMWCKSKYLQGRCTLTSIQYESSKIACLLYKKFD